MGNFKSYLIKHFFKKQSNCSYVFHGLQKFYIFFYKTFQDKLEHLDLIEGVIVDLLQTKWKSFIKKNFFIQMAMYSVYFVISLFVFVSR